MRDGTLKEALSRVMPQERTVVSQSAGTYCIAKVRRLSASLGLGAVDAMATHAPNALGGPSQ